jgi:hypothetical protein
MALALQGSTSLLFNLCSPCKSLCGFTRSRSTEAAPVGLNNYRSGGLTKRDEPGSISSVTLFCPKRWQRLNCSGLFGANCDYTDTRRPQSSEIDRTLDTLGPGVT